MNTRYPKLLVMLSAILCLRAIRSESRTMHPESLPRDAFAGLNILGDAREIGGFAIRDSKYYIALGVQY